MSEAKRMAGPYEITHAIHIGDREIVLGENPADTDRMLCICKEKAPLLFEIAGPACVTAFCMEKRPCGHPRAEDDWNNNKI